MKKGFLWNRLNSPAAAIISSLIRMMTKLVPDIKPDNGGETPSVYLFSQLMTLEVAFLSPYVSRSLCRTLVARSKAPGVRARRDGDLDVGLGCFFRNLLQLHLSSPGLSPAHDLCRQLLPFKWRFQPGGAHRCAGDTGSSIITPTAMCTDIYPSVGDPHLSCGF